MLGVMRADAGALLPMGGQARRPSARFAVVLRDRMRAAQWLADRAFGTPRRAREDEGSPAEAPAGEAPDFALLSLDERRRLLDLLRKARAPRAPDEVPAPVADPDARHMAAFVAAPNPPGASPVGSSRYPLIASATRPVVIVRHRTGSRHRVWLCLLLSKPLWLYTAE